MRFFETPMATVLPECEKGIARIEHRTPSKFDCMRAAWHGQTLFEETMASLFVRDTLMMSDGPEEKRTNWEFVYKAKGSVFIAGLGIGMVLAEILKKKEVVSVTIVEKYQDVVDLVLPHFKDARVTCIVSDIFDYRPEKGTKYDTIYFDIWPDICTDNLEDIATLHQRFKHYKAAGGWMGSWNQDYLRHLKRNGR